MMNFSAMAMAPTMSVPNIIIANTDELSFFSSFDILNLHKIEINKQPDNEIRTQQGASLNAGDFK